MAQNGSSLSLPFKKMHGLGNDFVVLDARRFEVEMTPALAKGLGDRHRGVGFDQLAVISASDCADLHLTFYNADGSVAGACGNATRCVADYEMEERGTQTLSLTTERGVLRAERQDGLVAVNMGDPFLGWRDVPLAKAMDTLELPIPGAPTATGMGNPHCTFFVEDAETANLEGLGPQMEHHSLFPQRTNVQIASVTAPDHLRMRVWERGVGVTLASGSSSCATAVAAHRRGLTGKTVRIDLDGGPIDVTWSDDGVWMRGATAHVFDGVLTSEWLASLG